MRFLLAKTRLECAKNLDSDSQQDRLVVLFNRHRSYNRVTIHHHWTTLANLSLRDWRQWLYHCQRNNLTLLFRPNNDISNEATTWLFSPLFAVQALIRDSSVSTGLVCYELFKQTDKPWDNRHCWSARWAAIRLQGLSCSQSTIFVWIVVRIERLWKEECLHFGAVDWKLPLRTSTAERFLLRISFDFLCCQHCARKGTSLLHRLAWLLSEINVYSVCSSESRYFFIFVNVYLHKSLDNWWIPQIFAGLHVC